MERSKASVISARFIICLAFAGLVDGRQKLAAKTLPERCKGLPCDKATFDTVIHKDCVVPFTKDMETTDYQLSCPWPTTKRFYVDLMMCLEKQAELTCCMVASNSHLVIKKVHDDYFSMCPYLKDPGVPTLLLLVVPCAIVPLLIPFLCQYFKLHEYRLPNDNH